MVHVRQIAGGALRRLHGMIAPRPSRHAIDQAIEAFRGHARRDVFATIEAGRRRLEADQSPLDDGSLEATGLYDRGKTVGDVTRGASKPADHCRLLHELVRSLSPRSILELGTNTGISSAYIASAAPAARMVTIDASPYRQRAAARLHREVGVDVDYVTGLFDEVLAGVLAELGPVDLAFIDGNHRFRPTLDYTAQIAAGAAPNAVFVYDDIRWSDEMARAWSEICTDPRFDKVFDLDKIGIATLAEGGNAPVVERVRLFP